MSYPWNVFETSLPPLSSQDRPLKLPELCNERAIEPVIVLGAGLAGCWLARLLAERGIAVRLIDKHASVASGASGNPAGIVKPHVTRQTCPAMDFHVAAHEYLLQQLQTLTEQNQRSCRDSIFKATGVLQLVEKAFPTSLHYTCVDKSDAELIAGIPLSSPALHFAASGSLNPGALCQELAGHSGITLSSGCRVSGISRRIIPTGQPCWHISTSQGESYSAFRLILACGSALNGFAQTQSLPLVAARGQISRFRVKNAQAAPLCVINGRHYIIPDGDTVLVGATYDRGILDERVHARDHTRNLIGLQETAPAIQVHTAAIAGYAGVRATTPDRLPLVGPAPDADRIAREFAQLRHGRPTEQYPALPCHAGLFVLGGLGSRGIVTAPISAKILADMLMSADTEAWDRWGYLLNPARFQIRDLKRGKVRADPSMTPGQ